MLEKREEGTTEEHDRQCHYIMSLHTEECHKHSHPCVSGQHQTKHRILEEGTIYLR